MAAPEIRSVLSNWISTNLPKGLYPKLKAYVNINDHSIISKTREIESNQSNTYLELLLRTIFALPKASRTGFD
jgi:hypothetical protein